MRRDSASSGWPAARRCTRRSDDGGGGALRGTPFARPRSKKMRLLLIAILVGVAWGYGSGGRLQVLAGVSLRAPFLLPVALGLQMALGRPPLNSLADGPRFAVVVISYGFTGAWLVVNARTGPRCLRAALGLLAAGWILNLVVMVPNGGMPVSPSAMDAIGVPTTAAAEEGYLSKHVTASPSTVLLFLGDVIPASGLRSVLSIGDLVMAVGLSTALARGMRPETGDVPVISGPVAS